MPSQKENHTATNDHDSKDDQTSQSDTDTSSKKRTKRTNSSPNRLKKSKSAQHPPYMKMIFDAITQTSHFGRSISAAAIRNYIKNNYDGLGEGGLFTANIRKALHKGLDDGLLEQGDTLQQYKLSAKGKKELKEEEKRLNGSSEKKKVLKLKKHYFRKKEKSIHFQNK